MDDLFKLFVKFFIISFFVSDFYIREFENYRILKINFVWGIKKKRGGGIMLSFLVKCRVFLLNIL